MNRYKVVFLCVLLLLLSSVAYAKIVFSSERDGVVGKLGSGVKGIYVMDDDGSNLTLLIEENKWLKPGSPRWSPDGKQILFEGREHLHLMNADGSRDHLLVRKPEGVSGLIMGGSFSPDGKSIVFSRDFVENKKTRTTITVMDIATREMKIISDVDAVNCEWSPDGKHIVFDSPSGVGGNGGTTIWIMRADGHNPHPLVPALPGTNRLKPRWSPDGKQIAFLHREYTWKKIPNGPTTLVYHAHRYMICDRDGGNIEQLQIPKDYEAVSLDWMDDGKSIVFTAIAGAPIDKPILDRAFVWPPSYVYKYHIWTGEITQLTNNPEWDQVIDWISDDVLPVSPQGKKKVTWGTIKQQGSE